jgi:miniconductance mechanosensitive channel
VDPSSIKSIDEELLSKLREKPQIKSFLEEFMESEEYKSSIEIDVTNLMLFRFYIRYFLLKQEKIRGDLNVSARLLQPIESGFPLEIYAFTTETTFSKYENFQAQIFEHIVAFSHYFDIRLFQKTDS